MRKPRPLNLKSVKAEIVIGEDKYYGKVTRKLLIHTVFTYGDCLTWREAEKLADWLSRATEYLKAQEGYC